MQKSKLGLDFQKVEYARGLAKGIAQDVQTFVEQYTTVAVERRLNSTLRLLIKSVTVRTAIAMAISRTTIHDSRAHGVAHAIRAAIGMTRLVLKVSSLSCSHVMNSLLL